MVAPKALNSVVPMGILSVACLAVRKVGSMAQHWAEQKATMKVDYWGVSKAVHLDLTSVEHWAMLLVDN